MLFYVFFNQYTCNIYLKNINTVYLIFDSFSLTVLSHLRRLLVYILNFVLSGPNLILAITKFYFFLQELDDSEWLWLIAYIMSHFWGCFSRYHPYFLTRWIWAFVLYVVMFSISHVKQHTFSTGTVLETSLKKAFWIPLCEQIREKITKHSFILYHCYLVSHLKVWHYSEFQILYSLS